MASTAEAITSSSTAGEVLSDTFTTREHVVALGVGIVKVALLRATPSSKSIEALKLSSFVISNALLQCF